MSKIKLKATLLFLLLLLFSCTQTKQMRKVVIEEHQLLISGFSEPQRQFLEKTIRHLKSLRPNELQITKTNYRRLSRFNSLFGFAFHGVPLSDWVLRRFSKVSYANAWTVAVNQNRGTLVIGDLFFKSLTDLERLYLLIHEARHSDLHGFKHSKCPKGFPFVSAGQPKFDLEDTLACDKAPDGAYAYQAAFLFELFAYGLLDQREAGLLYNSAMLRIIR